MDVKTKLWGVFSLVFLFGLGFLSVILTFLGSFFIPSFQILNWCSSNPIQKGIATSIPLVVILVLLMVCNMFIDKTVKRRFKPSRRQLGALVIGLLTSYTILSYLGFFTCAAKPVIYLYPEKQTGVSVRLETNGLITASDPPYPASGWSVYAEPSGLINGRYPYLFYEAATLHYFNSNEGWVVPAGEISSWFREYLPKLGLNPGEVRDFTDYWDVHLPPARYYQISLIPKKELDEMVKLDITPQPKTSIRVVLLIKPLDAPKPLKEPLVSTPERTGFTVVEWGVIFSG